MPKEIGYPGGFHPTIWKGGVSELCPKIREQYGWIWNGLRSPAKSFRYEFADELLDLVAANWPTPWSPRRLPPPRPRPYGTTAPRPPSEGKRLLAQQEKIAKARAWHLKRFLESGERGEGVE